MRRVVRIILWGVKGVLGVIALGALVMWPVSCGRTTTVYTERCIVHSNHGERRWYLLECRDGWLIMGKYRGNGSGGSFLALIRDQARRRGDGWRWQFFSLKYTWFEADWPSRWGPIRWNFFDRFEPGAADHGRRLAAPLSLVALVAGAWPLTSIAFALRRRIRRRRAARVGLCTRCGYDLRATPEKTGELLAVCPECGEATLPRKASAAPR